MIQNSLHLKRNSKEKGSVSSVKSESEVDFKVR